MAIEPSISWENVPIPELVPTFMNGDCWIFTLVWSATTIKLWTAVVSPTETLTMDFWLNCSVVSNWNTVVIPVIVDIWESNLAVLSVPGIWPSTRYRNVPTPAVVEPIPTVLVLTNRLLLVSFSNDKEITPPETFNPNVPIFWPENWSNGEVS